MAKVRITWIKSDIGYVKEQRRTLKALGFHRLGETVEHNDSPSVLGMIDKVSHLVKAEVIGDGTD